MGKRKRHRELTSDLYPKPRPTFADALAAVRCAIWRERTLATSLRRSARTKPRFRFPAPWAYALCHAAWMAKVELRGSHSARLESERSLIGPIDSVP
ncbi:hypothetical protein F1D61_32665 (plasmid) [Methylobacterium aquaticum]|nr:hypothetical protein F1D61_32665 [Methylobacterium aquaticum]